MNKIRVGAWLAINLIPFTIAFVAITIFRPSLGVPFFIVFFIVYLPIATLIKAKREAKKQFPRDSSTDITQRSTSVRQDGTAIEQGTEVSTRERKVPSTLLWIVAALALVFFFNLMQSLMHH